MCLFYETQNDLVDALIPYCLSGLQNNECCVFVAAEPLDAVTAKQIMIEADPVFADCFKTGQMQIFSYSDWYLRGGKLDLERVTAAWLDSLRAAVGQGYEGLRVAGDTSWVTSEYRRSLLDYERRLVEAVAGRKLIVLCLYPLDRCDALEVVETAGCHRAVLAKRDGKWRLFENVDLEMTRRAVAEYEKIAEKLTRVNRQLEKEIAERRQAEEHFATAFRASPNPLAIIAVKDRRYLDVNEAWTRTLGYPRHSVVGRTVDELNVWLKPTPQELIEMIKQDGRIRNQELRVRTQNGEERIWLCSAEYVHFNGERCLMCASIDITEKRRWERQMARYDRLDLVGRMAASVAHEVRNPMSSARGFVQILQEKQECAGYKDQFQLVIEELDRANSIISEFLSLARDRVINLTKLSINNAVRVLLPLIEADAMKENKTVIARLTPVPELLLDERELRQLILNLARNGLEAMGAGGTLTIETYQDGDDVVLAVRDEGHGITPEVLEELGTPFFTTKQNGTGLGLAVCHSIAAKHNAVITVQTGPQGTVFYTRFSRRKSRRSRQLYPVETDVCWIG